MKELTESKFSFGMKNGHIMLPRSLCHALFIEQSGPMGELMAFAFMLTKVNYSERIVNGRIVERGCSLLTQEEWGDHFGWKKSKTRRFFDMLEQAGVIRIYRGHYPLMLRIMKYEELCANRRPVAEKPSDAKPMSKSDLLFEEFWENYHAVTQQMPADKYGALKVWRKLPYAERILAAECVEQYFMSLPDVRHVRKAINYLKDKSFIME